MPSGPMGTSSGPIGPRGTHERLERWASAAAFTGTHTARVGAGEAVALARYCAGGDIFSSLPSRTQANNAAQRGALLVNGERAHGATRIRSGDVLTLRRPPPPPLAPGEVRRLDRFFHTLTTPAPTGPSPTAAVTAAASTASSAVGGRLAVLYEDEEMAVVMKPAGVHSAPWEGTRTRWGTLTVTEVLPLLLMPPTAAPAPLPAPLPAHRLDARVGGVLAVAKTRRALAALCRSFEERRVSKRYRAVVVGQVDLAALVSHTGRMRSESADAPEAAEGGGEPPAPIGQLTCTLLEKASSPHGTGELRRAVTGALTEGEDGSPRRVAAVRVEERFADGRRSVTEVRVLRVTPCAVHGALTTLDLRPLTGRRHQLRIACALGLHAPIVGDDLYHERASAARAARGLPALPPVRRRAGLFLQALEIRLPHPATGQPIRVRAPEAARFGKLRARAASGAGFTEVEWRAWRE